MLSRLVPLAPLVLLAACAAPAPGDDLAPRTVTVTAPPDPSEARPVVAAVVSEQVPGALGSAVAECVMTNAATAELVTIAGAVPSDPNPDVVLLIADILARPETVACATAANV
ncbi:hypothetical protein OG2516_08057 [Oceanicola granulosus HTCC2516]|uniref:Succinate dehydrogenase n=1 Tax=Oceanicola granulosus (strain ATCC BAA-861 / DSM 15982 / KCTC 12143 / HTCC2516) TaxID=314256 RepID=Q2CI43_OCEGH|nr:hypothetical protein [Oceanicola granulosus]EAR52415.1 hypothetical protein OG2516_08057 [Oceanicola granulosus HTCC2516]